MPNKYLQKKSKELEKLISDRGNKFFISCDLDDTLTCFTGWKGYEHIGNPRPDIVKFLRLAKKIKNAYIIIYTCRVSDSSRHILSGSVEAVKKWLNRWSIPFDEIWTGRGKPFSNLYIDDLSANPNCKECMKRAEQCLR